MKKLLKISIKVWIALAAVVSAGIILLIVLLRMNVESAYKTNITVDKTGQYNLIVDSNAAYILKEKDKVILRINGIDYQGSMDKISYDEKEDHFVAHLSHLGKQLIPSSTVPAQIIYGHTSVWGALVNPGV